MLVKVPNLAVPTEARHFHIHTSFGTSRKPEYEELGLGTIGFWINLATLISGYIILKPNMAFHRIRMFVLFSEYWGFTILLRWRVRTIPELYEKCGKTSTTVTKKRMKLSSKSPSCAV